MPISRSKMLRLCAAGFAILLAAPFAQATPGSRSSITHARNFEITDFPDHRRITVRNAYRDSTATHSYALVPKTASLPELPADVTVVRTPVERVVVMETVYIGYLEALGLLDTIAGAATVDFITHPEVRERIDNGEIVRVQTGQSLDVERLLLLQPDLILTSITGDPTFDVPAKLGRSGLPVVLSAGYMERHPLARSEWIKFIAAFFDAEAEAVAQFGTTVERYAALRARAAAVGERPTVFCAAPYSGVWHMPGGQSYTAQMIRDAGGDYLWADDPNRGSIPLDTERVFLKAAQADIWLNPSFYRSLDALFGADARFRKFKAAHGKQVYNNTRQVGDNGGNAVWESGITHPDVVLADLIKVFHPELMPDWDFVYYEKLP